MWATGQPQSDVELRLQRMSDSKSGSEVSPHSKTLAVEAEGFSYQTIGQLNGRASVIRCELKNPDANDARLCDSRECSRCSADGESAVDLDVPA